MTNLIKYILAGIGGYFLLGIPIDLFFEYLLGTVFPGGIFGALISIILIKIYSDKKKEGSGPKN